MSHNIDNLKKLFDQIRSISFLGRVFRWKRIKDQLIDAIADLQGFISAMDHQAADLMKSESQNYQLRSDLKAAGEQILRKENELLRLNDRINISDERITAFIAENSSKTATLHSLNNQVQELQSANMLLRERSDFLFQQNKKNGEEIASQSQTIAAISVRKSELEVENSALKSKLQEVLNERETLQNLNTKLLKDEEFRRNEHSNAVSALTEIRNQIIIDRNQEVQDRNDREIQKLKALKETWSRHQGAAKQIIKAICQKHIVQYVDKVPFKGDPDNTLLICDEFIVFDAKSPGGDDLSNFPSYLKDQAEKAKKYARQENVKTDVFFVVPTNVLERLEVFSYKHDSHNVFIISVDALEPIILSLKKLENYEFAEQLSPEDRENICRVLGQFAHLSKRRIQVDGYFARQFIELAYRCESDLPREMLKSAIEFEKSGKLNPPMEKRAKAIPVKDVENDMKEMRQAATAKGIITEDDVIAQAFNELPLYSRGNGGE